MAGPSDQSKAGPPGLLGGRARAEALAKLTPALPAVPPPPRSLVQGAQWVRPALPCALYRATRLAEAHLCEEGRCRHVRNCTKPIEHLRCTSKWEPGHRYRPAASLALPRGLGLSRASCVAILSLSHPAKCGGPHHDAPEPCSLLFSSLSERPLTLPMWSFCNQVCFI